MTITQRIFAITVSFLFLLLVAHLVRKRKFDIKYSIVWLLTGVTIFILAFEYNLLLFVMRLIGAQVPTTPLFIFAILFLIIFGLQVSIQLTEQSAAIKALTQELALLRFKLEQQENRSSMQKPADTSASDKPIDHEIKSNP